MGNRRGEVFTLCHLGNARWRLGRQPEALVLLHEALALADEIGDQHARAWASSYLGQIGWEDGRRDAALPHLLRALDLFTELGDPTAADVRAMLASLDRENPPPAGGLHGMDPDPELIGPG
jgi:tetratricopeptide (TPR) repeat protein